MTLLVTDEAQIVSRVAEQLAATAASSASLPGRAAARPTRSLSVAPEPQVEKRAERRQATTVTTAAKTKRESYHESASGSRHQPSFRSR